MNFKILILLTRKIIYSYKYIAHILLTRILYVYRTGIGLSKYEYISILIGETNDFPIYPFSGLLYNLLTKYF